MQLGAAFAGGTNISDGETRFIRHRHERRFAITRVAFEADLFGVHRFVSLEIIQRAARAPGPRTQRAPIIDLARLSFVAEANDAAGQTRAVVSLNAGWESGWHNPSLWPELVVARLVQLVREYQVAAPADEIPEERQSRIP